MNPNLPFSKLTVNLIQLYALVLFCSLCFFTSSVRAQQECTPVVYAFRHAEDFKDTNGLTPVGVQHAALYVGTVDQFESGGNYCPVGWVYSMYNFNPNGSPGTNNPFQTAAPLAHQACITRAFLSGARPPDDPCRDPASDFLPHMQLRDDKSLYENFEESTNISATKGELREELVSNARDTALSSAIFWTSEGLHTLGTAIADGTDIPVKGAPGSPPRNAVYVFKYNDNARTFNPPDPVNGTQYLQCFNINVRDPTSSPAGTNYYCKPGDIPSNAAYIAALRGKICDTTTLGTQENGFKGPC